MYNMFKISKDIDKYFTNFSFPNFEFSADDVDYFISSINNEDFTWDDGATKLVIIPYNTDYVIKIPFSGEKRYNYNEEIDSYENYFKRFNMAPLNSGYDYCKAETKFYKKAQEAGLDEIFLPVYFVAEKKDYPIYIQPKAVSYESLECGEYNITEDLYKSSENSKAIIKKIKESGKYSYNCFFSLPTEWIAKCLDLLGSIEKLKDFFNFLEETGIDRDLHYGNIGYYKNKAVIIDYGGYKDCS